MRQIVRTALVCSALLLAASCGEGEPVPLGAEMRHENGLTVKRPEGFEVARTPTGFDFAEKGNLRSPRRVRATVAARMPAAEPQGSRRLPDGEIAAYATKRYEGGSGGDEYELVVWKPGGDTWIVIREHAQSEWGVPGFAVAWALMEKARIAQAAGDATPSSPKP